MKDTKYYETLLKDQGYDIKEINSKRITIKTDLDRKELLIDIANKISGSVYSDSVYASSVGGVKLPEGFLIIAKPNKITNHMGTEKTSIIESAHCAYLSSLWFDDGLFSIDSFQRSSKWIDITETYDNIITNTDETWQEVITKISVLLKNNFGDKEYVFHRGSEWVNILNNYFRKLNKEEKIFKNLNKWQPADIYLIDPYENFNYENIENIQNLNKFILYELKNKKIIPVSLKKSFDPSLKYINFYNDDFFIEMPIKFYSLGLTNFFNSKDVHIFYNNNKIQFRTFDVLTFQGEIKGKLASHGKIGFGEIQRIIKYYTSNQMDYPKTIQKRLIEDKNIISDFYYFYTYLQDDPVDFIQFSEGIKNKTADWLISKIIGLQLIYILVNTKNTKEIVKEIIKTAASESSFSAPHVKIL